MEKFLYSIVSQQTTSNPEKSDSVFFSALHDAIRTSLEKQFTEELKSTNEIIQKAVSGLRGTLSPYLSTPLKSDKGDIEKNIKDIIDFVIQQVSGTKNTSSLGIATYKMIDPSQVPLKRQSVGIMRRLLRNGKRMLSECGVATGRITGTVYRTEIQTATLLALAPIQTGFRESFEQDAEYHGVIHYDRLSTMVHWDASNEGEGDRILLGFTATGDVVERVKNRCANLKNQFGIVDVCLTERSFFSDCETSVQFSCTADLSVHPLGSIILALAGDDSQVKKAVTVDGSLLILKKIA